jgi:hypothetical protein
LAINAEGGEILSPKQKDRTTTHFKMDRTTIHFKIFEIKFSIGILLSISNWYDFQLVYFQN